jgi:2-amino-4-hydroxy-6-hydroxymethyldihydropteridine diphosphokinase
VIFIGLGANQPGTLGQPRETIASALDVLAREAGDIVARSDFYRSAPVPASDQPWFINVVASIKTSLSPEELLALLHRIETQFGRERRVRNEARVLDLDLIAYHERIESKAGLILPHPGMHERAFVLLPLTEIAPGWIHPRLGLNVTQLIERLPPGQTAERLDSRSN